MTIFGTLEKFTKVNGTETLQELYDALLDFDEIQSINLNIKNTSSKYWAGRLAIVKNQVDTGVGFNRIQWTLLTRTYGIRQHAMQLAFYQRQAMVTRGECNF